MHQFVMERLTAIPTAARILQRAALHILTLSQSLLYSKVCKKSDAVSHDELKKLLNAAAYAASKLLHR
jgi:hypothetical protein